MNLKKSGYLISKFINYFGLFLLVPLVVFLFPIENLSDNTTITGAFKLIGSTNSGINYGFVNANTREESGKLSIKT